MLRLNQIKLSVRQDQKLLAQKAAEFLGVPRSEILEVHILRQSIDARKKPELFYSYTLDVAVKREAAVLKRFRGKGNLVSLSEQSGYVFPKPGEKILSHPPVIVGMGPAGLFCGYYLALHGYRPVLLERGKAVEERKRDVERFWETGHLDPASNVLFGEGGAGTFSDGKLNTLVRDKDGRNGAVLETLVRFGAKESIRYEAKPHIGTDALCQIVERMRLEIIRLGGTVRFESCVTGIETQGGQIQAVEVNGRERIPCGQVVLASGHSARDTFDLLLREGIPMEAKPFAVGLRVEHPQEMIDESQYGGGQPDTLGAASYKVTAKAADGRGVYSFCMCPGGYVVNASSEEGYLAVNGMSYSGRSGKNANSAIIVTVTPEDFGGSHPLAGVAFQRQLERRAYELGQGRIPIQRYGDFKARTEGWEGDGFQGEASFLPQCKGEYVWADVSRILPPHLNRDIVEGMEAFGRQIQGFDRPDAILSGVESRTSSPVRILRDESLQSAVRGLYPCGEGAGYAGGITSAAMDGLRVAEAIAGAYAPFVQPFEPSKIKVALPGEI